MGVRLKVIAELRRAAVPGIHDALLRHMFSPLLSAGLLFAGTFLLLMRALLFSVQAVTAVSVKSEFRR